MRAQIRTVVFMCASLLVLVSGSNAQNSGGYPDTMRVNVVFYDFHADGSNPEFNPNHTSNGIHLGMVVDTLSSERKPVLGKSPYFSYYLHKWFKPWVPGDFTVPVYTNTAGAYGGIQKVKHDTAFKNIVIHDSLPFLHLGNRLYRFERSGSDATPEFFWIDGKGFGNEPSGYNHNYSFTMELHTKFTYQPGLVFEFLGDDDVWVFVNGSLVMDLGGIHISEAGTVNLDKLGSSLGLVAGREYDLDFFYAERHIVKSCIKITTNMIMRNDSIGPYVNKATLFGAATGTGSDTLKLAFNEPVNCQQLLSTLPESVFVYIDDGKNSSKVLHGASFIGSCTQTFISEVLIIVPDNKFKSALKIDSIGFVAQSPHVTDMTGNHPSDEKRRVAVELPATAAIELNVNPSPVRIGQEIDISVRKAYQPVIGENKHGALVGIYSKTPLLPMNVGGVTAYGRADIYDATANLVQQDLPVKSAGREGVYGIYWDVKNRNGRFVGSGTYLAMIMTTDATGKESTRRVKVGVRR